MPKYLGACLISADPESIDSATEFLRQNFTRLAIYVDVRRLKAWNDLNTGATKTFVTFEQLKALAQEPTITPDRLVLTISSENPKTDTAKLKAFLNSDPSWKTAEWAFDGDRGKDYIDDILKELSNYPLSADQTTYITVASKTAGLELLHQYPGDSLIILSERLTFDSAKDEPLIPATQLILADASADWKTRLYATTVIDERGVALGSV